MSYSDYLPLSVCESTPLKDFFETPVPILLKLHVEPFIKWGLKICTNGHGR